MTTQPKVLTEKVTTEKVVYLNIQDIEVYVSEDLKLPRSGPKVKWEFFVDQGKVLPLDESTFIACKITSES